jgi:tetratricopeptide (TPR) repeat protein
MALATEIIFNDACRYSEIHNIPIEDVYSLLEKNGKLPKLDESQITERYRAEDLAFEVLLKNEQGYRNIEEHEDNFLKAQKANFLYSNNLIVINAMMEMSKSVITTKAWMEKGLLLASKVFDKQFEEENKGYYWGLNQTRPFIRMLLTKMDYLEEEGKRKEAIIVAERIIYLNEKDNNGVRDVLQRLYLMEKKFDDYIEIIEKFPDDYSVSYFYNYALYLYIIEGANHPDTEEAMQEAIEFNPFVLPYLTKKKKLGELNLNYYNPREEDGAQLYYEENIALWQTVYGVQNWLKKFC